MIIHREHHLQRVDASGRPLVPHSKSSNHSPTMKLPPLKQAQTAPALTTDATGRGSRKWTVEHSSLPTRPDDLPLLPTTRVVHGITASTISNFISDCLRIRSVKMIVSKSHGNLARCINTDFCRFNVRLYSTDDGAVLVEVHRLCGDAVSFMRDCRAVFHAAEGKSMSGNMDGEDLPMFLRLPVSQMKFLGSITLPPTSQEEYSQLFKGTSDLLLSHQTDSNMLGMESLVIQTDPIKTDKSSAVNISRRILSPTDKDNHGFNMHNHLMSILLYNDRDITPDAGDTSLRSLREDTFQSDHVAKLRNLALLALSNALELFSSENLLSTTIATDLEWYTSVLIPTLVHDLDMATDNPVDACYASRCLSTLAKSSVDLANRMEASGARDAAKNAEEIGIGEFAMLAQEARTCRESFCVVRTD